MTGATDVTRKAVWQEMLDTARLVRYYGRMASGQQRRSSCVRLVLLASATAGVAAAFDALPEAVRALSSAVVAVLVALDFVADHANKAAVLDSIKCECSDVQDELAVLWGDVQADSIHDDDARRKLAELAHRVTRATSRAGSARVSENERLNIRCAKDAYKALEDQYAVG